MLGYVLLGRWEGANKAHYKVAPPLAMPVGVDNSAEWERTGEWKEETYG